MYFLVLMRYGNSNNYIVQYSGEDRSDAEDFLSRCHTTRHRSYTVEQFEEALPPGTSIWEAMDVY